MKFLERLEEYDKEYYESQMLEIQMMVSNRELKPHYPIYPLETSTYSWVNKSQTVFEYRQGPAYTAELLFLNRETKKEKRYAIWAAAIIHTLLKEAVDTWRGEPLMFLNNLYIRIFQKYPDLQYHFACRRCIPLTTSIVRLFVPVAYDFGLYPIIIALTILNNAMWHPLRRTDKYINH